MVNSRGGLEGQDDREVTPPPLTKEQIEGHLSALKSIIKDHNKKNRTDPIWLDFEIKDTKVRDNRIVKGKTVVGDDLKKPFKGSLKTPLTHKIIEFVGPEYKIPINIKLYDGTKDLEDHLNSLAQTTRGSGPCPYGVECSNLREAFSVRYLVRRACFKEPREITKIIRRANKSLTAFKDRWTVETGFIMGVPEVMKISSFMDSLKRPELEKHFLSKVPTMVNEMMGRLDDFVWSKEAFSWMELPKGEIEELHQRSVLQLPSGEGSPHKRLYSLEEQLKWALESRKLNHLVGKRKNREVTKAWMDTLRTFPPVSSKDIFNEPLIVEAEIEGYLVRWAEGNLNGSGGFRKRGNKAARQDRARDVAETFDNLKRINMKLNPKKCSFGVEEGKFLEVVPKSDDTEEWILFMNGASNLKGSGAGLVLIDPSGIEYTYALRLTFTSTKNEAEYEVLLAGVRIARRMKIQRLEAMVNSKLVASQINESYAASNDRMIKYLAKAKEYIACFISFSIKNIPRNLNQKADVLSKLASVAFNHLTKEVFIKVLNEQSTEGIWLKDKNEARNLWVKINQYAMEDVVLFKKSYLVPMLRCVGPLQANYVIRFAPPRIIITDNGTQFVNDLFKGWCARLNIKQLNTIVSHPQANGLVERVNKCLREDIKTRIGRERAGWVDELPNVLWTHQTSIKQSNGETSFILTYRSEAVIPTEIGMPTYRTMMIREGFNKESSVLI
nr:reverse transcriptase domain-containing protein [Tanacetum cinerariifolium]